MDNSLTGLLSSLAGSLESAASTVPEHILLPKDGISLLDVKNELLLSYLQNLVFLIILKLRNSPNNSLSNGTETDSEAELNEYVVKKLVELRTYLEKGVRPLEGRLKYQVDKVVQAAEDASRTATSRKSNGVNGTANPSKGAEPGESVEESDGEESEGESKGSGSTEQEIDELSYRPNPAALMKPKAPAEKRRITSTAEDGIYRPPRITPMAPPTSRRGDDRERKPTKSATIDEFVASELSAAPMAEPSIGSNITAGGRRSKSQRERDDDAEKQTYEESNFVRLPKESKKDRQKKGRPKDAGYGGEDWRNLGIGLDRIDRMTQKKGGTAGALAKSRKRAVEDGPRGTGAELSEAFGKRRKVRN